MKLTAAQQHNLSVIKKAGGTVEYNRVRFSFTALGSKEPIRGMNTIAMRSLIKLGLLTESHGEPGDKRGVSSFSIVKRSVNPSYQAALAAFNKSQGGS